MLILLCIAYILLILLFPIIGGIVSIILAFLLKNKKSLFFLIIGILLLALFIALYIPDVKNDLYRYFQTMTEISNLPDIPAFLEYSKSSSTLQYQNNPLFNLFEYKIAQTSYFYLLPYLTIVICYFCILYPIYDLREKNKISFSISIVLAIGMLSIYSIFYITTFIRWSLACATFILCTYMYFMKLKAKKANIWILLIPLLIHLGIILAVGVVIYVAIIKKENKFNLLLPVPFFFLILVLSLFTNITNTDNIIFKIISMLQGYQYIARPNTFSDWISYLLDIGTAIILFFIVNKVISKNILKSDISKFEFNFKELFLLYLFMITSIQILQRYVLIIGALSLIVYAINYQHINKKQLFNFYIIICIVIRIYFIWYMKFKGMFFQYSGYELWFNDLLFYMQHIFYPCF